MNAKYLRSSASLLFSKVSVEVQFKNLGQSYEGPIEGFRRFIKSHPKAVIASTQVDGQKGGLYVTFTPSNQQQRELLSECVGVEVQRGQSYTFGSRQGAAPFWKLLKEKGIHTTNRQWKYSAVVHPADHNDMPV